MNQRSIILSLAVVAFSVLLFSRVALSTSKDNAPKVEFRLEKLSEKDYPDVHSEAGIMQTIKDNLYAAKDAITSKLTELTGKTHEVEEVDTTETIKRRAAEMAGKASDQADSVKHTVYETMREAEDKASELMQDVKGKIVEVQDAAEEKMQDAKHSLKHGADTLSAKAADVRDATIEAKDKVVDKSSAIMSEAYLKMKEAFEALSTQMNDAKNRVASTTDAAKENVKSTLSAASDKADELKHDAYNKYQEAVGHVPLTKTATVEHDSNLFTNAYNRMKIAFEELGAKLRGQKEEVQAELYETKDDKGVMAEWYHSMRASFDTLGDKIKDLTHRNKDVKVEVQVKDADDVNAKGKLYGLMSELYESVHNAYQRLPGVDSSVHDKKFKVESVDAKNSVRDKIQDAKEYIQDLYHGTKNEAKDQYHDAKNEMKDQYHDRKNDVKDTEETRSRVGELYDDAKARVQNVGERIAEAVGIHKNAELEGECVNRGKDDDKDMCTARTSAGGIKVEAKVEARK